MAGAVAEGARSAAADVKRVPELVAEEVARSSHRKLDQAAPGTKPGELVDDDAIIVGIGARYGRITSQMASPWDQTNGLWARNKLVNKVAG